MTNIYIMFSDRIPFVNIEIVTLFVKKKNQETITNPSDNSNERIRICLFVMNIGNKKDLSTFKSIIR